MTREGVKDKIFQWPKWHLHEPETLYKNLYNENDEKTKLCIQKAIDSKNAWDQIYSNKKIQKIMIIRTAILAISAILQILINFFKK